MNRDGYRASILGDRQKIEESFTLLAQTHEKQKLVGRYLMSEKLDGQRAIWDGGISRGKRVPWHKDVCTGLWSRYSKIIHASDKFLDALPPIPLDGELWLGYKQFQTLMSVTRSKTKSAFAWGHIQYKAFDVPPLKELWRPRWINIPNLNFKITQEIQDMMASWAAEKGIMFDHDWDFEHAIAHIPNKLVHEQEVVKSIEHVFYKMEEVLKKGGEGVIVRKSDSYWIPYRLHDVLKFKEINDGEAVVTGFISGSETDKGSKLLGRIGSLMCEWTNPNGKIVCFNLAGLNDSERDFDSIYDGMPSAVVPTWIDGAAIKRGSTISFKYRELTNDGLPKDARYWRKYQSI